MIRVWGIINDLLREFYTAFVFIRKQLINLIIIKKYEKKNYDFVLALL